MIKMNLQFFGGRGSAGGNNPRSSSAAESTSSIISRVSDTASKSWGESYVPLTEKQVQNLTTKLEKFDSDAFRTQKFETEENGGNIKRKIEGMSGQFRFIDYGSQGLIGRYEVNYIVDGLTNAVTGKTPQQALANAAKEFKEVTVRETLYKKRKK